MKITKYPDGSSYVEVDTFEDFTYRINSYEDLWHLAQILEVYEANNVRPTVTIPCLIDAQADRRFAPNQSFGLRVVLRFLNRLYANFKIFHPHNPSPITMIMNHVEVIDNTQFIENVLEDLWFEDNLILMSSDAGGFKPLMDLCNKIGWEGETFSASKARSWDSLNKESKFVQQIDRQDFGGKDILIIDDLSIRGGTFKGLSKLLEGRNVGKKYLAVSHITVEDLGKDPVTNYFDRVFTTNSKFDSYISFEHSYFGNQPDNLRVYKMF